MGKGKVVRTLMKSGEKTGSVRRYGRDKGKLVKLAPNKYTGKDMALLEEAANKHVLKRAAARIAKDEVNGVAAPWGARAAWRRHSRCVAPGGHAGVTAHLTRRCASF